MHDAWREQGILGQRKFRIHLTFLLVVQQEKKNLNLLVYFDVNGQSDSTPETPWLRAGAAWHLFLRKTTDSTWCYWTQVDKYSQTGRCKDSFMLQILFIFYWCAYVLGTRPARENLCILLTSSLVYFEIFPTPWVRTRNYSNVPFKLRDIAYTLYCTVPYSFIHSSLLMNTKIIIHLTWTKSQTDYNLKRREYATLWILSFWPIVGQIVYMTRV